MTSMPTQGTKNYFFFSSFLAAEAAGLAASAFFSSFLAGAGAWAEAAKENAAAIRAARILDMETPFESFEFTTHRGTATGKRAGGSVG